MRSLNVLTALLLTRWMLWTLLVFAFDLKNHWHEIQAFCEVAPTGYDAETANAIALNAARFLRGRVTLLPKDKWTITHRFADALERPHLSRFAPVLDHDLSMIAVRRPQGDWVLNMDLVKIESSGRVNQRNVPTAIYRPRTVFKRGYQSVVLDEVYRFSKEEREVLRKKLEDIHEHVQDTPLPKPITFYDEALAMIEAVNRVHAAGVRALPAHQAHSQINNGIPGVDHSTYLPNQNAQSHSEIGVRPSPG